MKKALFTVLLFFFLASMVYSLGQPAITSPESGQWNSGSVYVRWSPVDGATGYAFFVDGSSGTEVGLDVECANETSKRYSRSDGVWFFHIASCKGSERSSTTHLEFRVDNTSPSRVEGLTAEQTSDAKIRLTWQASTDSYSGVDHYIIYRGAIFDFEIDDISTKKFKNIKGTEYVDGNVVEGYNYNYKIAAVDAVGNISPATVRSIGSKVSGICDYSIDISLTHEKDSNSLEITASSDVNMEDIVVSVKDPESEEFSEILKDDKKKSVSLSYSLSGKEGGEFIVRVSAVDNDNNPCSAQSVFSFDNAKPMITNFSPAEGSTLDKEATLSFSVADNGFSSGIKSVKLFISGKNNSFSELSFLSDEKGNYSHDLNYLAYESGTYKFKVEAEDNSGNKSDSIVSLKLVNSAVESENASARLSEAKELLSKILSSVEAASSIGLDVSAVSASLADANSGVYDADMLLWQEKYLESIAESGKAIALLKDAEKLVSVSVYKEASFFFTRAKLGEILSKNGFSGDEVIEAGSFYDVYKPSRKLVLIEVKSGAEDYFAAKAIVSANSADANVLYFYDVVSQEIISQLGEPVLSTEMEKVSSNPYVVKGALLAAAGTAKAEYSFSKKLSKEEADSLLAKKIAQDYTLPPIVFDGSAVYLGDAFSGSLALPSLDGIVSLAVPLLAVIIVVAVAFIFLSSRGKKGHKDLGRV